MIKNLYTKLFGGKFFNKILFFNALIISIALFSLTFIVSFNVTTILQTKEINFNTQILQSISNYMEQRYVNSNNILKQMYLENDRTPVKILDFIQYDYNKLSDEYIAARSRFENYLTSNVYRNKDIQSIIFYKSVNNSFYFSERGKPLLLEIGTTARESWGLEQKVTSGFSILPANKRDYIAGDNNVYSLATNISAPNVLIKIGEMVIDFNPDSVKSAYSDYADDVIGTLMVLTADGSVIFDSSNQYYGDKYPFVKMLKASGRNTYIDNNNIMNSIGVKEHGLIIAGIIPKSEISASIYKTQRMIFIVSFLCIIISLFITYIGVTFFSKRVNAIIEAMKKVRKGDLSVEFSIKNKQDEIGIITKNFEEMCLDLKEHINKVYVANIKQKSAELKALQSQINPHFLYNTLETIRMMAVVKGNKDVGDMISTLATMFRISLKEDMIIKIRDELKYCKMYMELIKIRYKDSFSDFYEIPDDIQELGIIKHLMQPIFENYIVHGIKQGEDDNKFWVKGRKEGDDIYLEFADNGNGFTKSKLDIINRSLEDCNEKEIFYENDSSNLGLANIDKRIKIIFGMKYGITIFSEESVGTKIMIKICAKTKKELVDYIQGFNCR